MCILVGNHKTKHFEMSILGEGAFKSLYTDIKMRRTDFDELNGDEICP